MLPGDAVLGESLPGVENVILRGDCDVFEAIAAYSFVVSWSKVSQKLSDRGCGFESLSARL